MEGEFGSEQVKPLVKFILTEDEFRPKDTVELCTHCDFAAVNSTAIEEYTATTAAEAKARVTSAQLPLIDLSGARSQEATAQ
jgi:hypothetical protein